MKTYKIKIEDQEYIVEVEEIGSQEKQSSTKQTYSPDDSPKSAPIAKKEPQRETKSDIKDEKTGSSTGEEITAPMPGKILKIMVSVGDKVSEGDPILILEAMKMENEVFAGSDGKIEKISVNVNDMVDTGDTLVIIN